MPQHLMKAASIPHYFNYFPTGNIPVPVCIGDLPLSDYAIPYYTMTEDVAQFLDVNPLIPGAMMVKEKQIIGIIPRHKMFERLGRRYGVELFLRKPVLEMCRELSADVFTLKSHMSINSAVRLALSRVQSHLYDPVVVEFEDHAIRLLDMYVLLLSQSQLSNNLSGIVSTLNNIEMILGNENNETRSTLDLILESLQGVVPAHNIRILLRERADLELFGAYTPMLLYSDTLESYSIYRSVLRLNQPTVIEDVHMVPAWLGSETPSGTRSWMGLPINNQHGPLGLLSLSRTSFSPFTNNEKEIAQVFARYIGKLFSNVQLRMDRVRSLEKKYQMR